MMDHRNRFASFRASRFQQSRYCNTPYNPRNRRSTFRPTAPRIQQSRVRRLRRHHQEQHVSWNYLDDELSNGNSRGNRRHRYSRYFRDLVFPMQAGEMADGTQSNITWIDLSQNYGNVPYQENNMLWENDTPCPDQEENLVVPREDWDNVASDVLPESFQTWGNYRTENLPTRWGITLEDGIENFQSIENLQPVQFQFQPEDFPPLVNNGLVISRPSYPEDEIENSQSIEDHQPVEFQLRPEDFPPLVNNGLVITRPSYIEDEIENSQSTEEHQPVEFQLRPEDFPPLVNNGPVTPRPLYLGQGPYVSTDSTENLPTGGHITLEDEIENSQSLENHQPMEFQLRLEDFPPLVNNRLVITTSNYLGQQQSEVNNDALSVETITKNLRTTTYCKSVKEENMKYNSYSDEEAEVCVICQDVYENNETLGRLQCGHEYHVGCIEKWLLQKNICPLCKRTALAQKNIYPLYKS